MKIETKTYHKITKNQTDKTNRHIKTKQKRKPNDVAFYNEQKNTHTMRKRNMRR